MVDEEDDKWSSIEGKAMAKPHKTKEEIETAIKYYESCFKQSAT